MKRNIYILLVVIVCALLPSCKQKLEGTSNKIKTVSATEITDNSALLSGEIGVEIANYKSVEFGMLISTDASELQSYMGTIKKGEHMVGQTFSIIVTNLSPNTQYYYRSYLLLNDQQEEYGEVKSFTTKQEGEGGEQEGQDDGKTQGHAWVDLGLNVKWATCNVGATKPEQYGYYFAWGETMAKSDYSWSTYKWCKGLYDSLIKYCSNSSYGSVDEKTTLDPVDDVASANWGGKWRMPTQAEYQDLIDKCSWIWTTPNGINGYKVTGKDGKFIFLPAAGYLSGSSPEDVGPYGYYWSSSLNASISHGSYRMEFSSDYPIVNNTGRYNGLPVRPVLGE